MLHDSQYSGYSEYTIMAPKFTFVLNSQVQVLLKLYIHGIGVCMVINKWLLKLITCKFEGDNYLLKIFAGAKKKGVSPVRKGL